MKIKTSTAEFAKVNNSQWLLNWRKSLPLLLCFAIPCMLLIGAYVHMIIRYEKLWLFDTIVHERGKYTLFEVIFYFRHFLWEVPIKIIFSLIIVGAFFYYGTPNAGNIRPTASAVPMKNIFLGCMFALSLVLLAILMTGHDVGFKDAFAGLLQFRTHEMRPLEFGSHWRNHLLSNIVLFSSTAFCVLFFRLITSGVWVKRRFAFLFYFGLGAFLILTLFFGVTSDPFETPSYLGHQLREIFGSDLSITMLLCLGVLIHLEQKYDMPNILPDKRILIYRKKMVQHLVFWAFTAILPTVFLIIKVLNLDISGEINKLGSTKGWTTVDLFAWHFFEHSLDYLFVVFLVYSFYLLTLKLELKYTSN